MVEYWSNAKQPIAIHHSIAPALQSQSDWMPGRLRFHGVEDPVGIFRVGAAPHFLALLTPRFSEVFQAS
jgi:hypothetical protein